MSLDTLNRYALAIELLSLKARVSIVAQETGLSPSILRKEFVEMHHRSPSKGSKKVSTEFIFKSYQLCKEATLFAFFFYIERSPDFCRRTINAYRRYSLYMNTVPMINVLIDFSDAWVISEWVKTRKLKLVRCSHCHSAMLINNKLQHHVCCVCRT